jgi:transposase-like protein
MMIDNRKIYTAAEKRAHVKACLEQKAEGHTIRSYINAHEFTRSATSSWLKTYQHEYLSAGLGHEDVLCTQVIARSGCVDNQQTSQLKVSAGAIAIELPAGSSESNLRRVLLALKEVI